MEQEENRMSKTIVAYFSASGTTKRAAEALASATGADIYEIRPAAPYTGADLDWTDKNSRSTVEMRDRSSRPELADMDANIGAYDRIFIGFPIWWYTAPTIINTFLESHDFAGKTIILFATSGGSGFGNTAQDLKRSVASSAVIREGRLLNGRLQESAIREWLSELGI